MMIKCFLFLLLLLPAAIYSQPLFSASLYVPALTVGRVPSRGFSTVVTFDKRVSISATGSHEGHVCLYINTRNGDLGIRFDESEVLEVCGLNVEDEKFRFTLIRATGQVQTYMTRNVHGVLKYLVLTGNTEINQVSFPPVRNTTLYRQAETHRRRRETIVSQAYRANSGGPIVYLHGPTLPRDVTVQDFLGFGSIGYVKTNRGIFMATRADLESMRLEAFRWQDVPTRLDISPFESAEGHMDAGIGAALDREENKLRAESYTGECGGEEDQLRRLKLADIASRRETMVRKNTGNIYENEVTRKAMADLIMPSFRVMNQELEVKICRATTQATRARSESTRAAAERRVRCYRTSQDELSQLQSEWVGLEARYPNDKGESYADRVSIRRRLMSLGNGCR